MAASDLAALSSLTPLIINMLRGNNQPNPGALLGTIPGGQDLLNGIVGQQQQQAPLRQAVTQQAMNMLPGSAFPGGRPALAPVGPGAAPATGGGGVNWPAILAAGAGGAGLGALLSRLASGGSGSGGGGDLSRIAQAIKNLLAGKPAGLSLPQAGGGVNPSNPFDNSFTGFFQGPEDFTGPRQPTPNVDTSTVFNGIPGGYPNNPEDPTSIDPNVGGLFGDGTPPEPGPGWGG